MKKSTVERMLSDTPVPPPPEGLAARIKDDIPDRLQLAPELAGPRPAASPRRRTTWYLAAAATLLAGLTATVTWQLRSSGPDTRLLERVATPPAPREAARIEQPVADREGALAEGREAQAQADSPHRDADGPGVSPRRNEAKEEAVSRDASGAVTPNRSGEQETAAAPADAMRERLRTPAATGKDKAADELRAGREHLDMAAKQQRAALPELSQLQPEPRPAAPESTIAGALQAPPPAGEKKAGGELYRSVATPPPRRAAAQVTGGLAEGAAPSTGGTTEPNDQPYGDVFFRSPGVNPFIDTEDDRLSTFGLDVDTASYTVIRRYLDDGHLPPPEAVRVEEVVNALGYGDRPPRRGDFALTAEGAPAPFAEGDRYLLLRFAVTARDVDSRHRPPAVLTFVVDTSGSMGRENRLGLVQAALEELLDQLREDDRVGLVTYGSRGEVLLEPTTDHGAVRAAILSLRPEGSTNAEEGLVLGYRLAERSYREGAINRVILCSDGVANVGRTGPDSILERVASSAQNGIELTTVGFGMGNYNDVLMERLADAGDGRYAYVDALPEARRIFVEDLTGTLLTVARDARAQVEFDPDTVSRYRLLGYENRDISDDRFRDPTVDAGEVGAGHTVTALYEVKLQRGVGRRDRAPLATLRLRYRPAEGGGEVELERSLTLAEVARNWRSSSPALRLASLAAEFAEILRGSYWAREGDLGEVLRRARELEPAFAGDARVADFVDLVATAARLRGQTAIHDDD